MVDGGSNDLHLHEREKQSVDGEEVGDDADDVDEDAVAVEEMDLPPDLPYVQTIDTFLQYEAALGRAPKKRSDPSSVHISYIVKYSSTRVNT